MKAEHVEQIVARIQAAPKEFKPVAHTYGLPVVMISCANAHQCEALAELLKHARADLVALLGGIGVDVEPVQKTMELV